MSTLRRLALSLSVASLALGGALVAAPAAQAAPTPRADTCGWTGNVEKLMGKADRQVRTQRVTQRVLGLFEGDAAITSYKRMEVDLLARSGARTSPTSAATLTVNHVSYNIQVAHGGSESTVTAQVRFDGLCYRTTVVVGSAWVGSTGTDQELKVSANKALKLAQEYRKKHQDEFPLSEPLIMMNLMQATTAPPDFGKLRWYVNYVTPGGGLSILAVYMNGKVRAM